MKEEIELKWGNSELKISTQQTAIVVLIVFLLFFMVYMWTFPNYSGSIYGNETIPTTVKMFLVVSPLALMIFVLGTLIGCVIMQ